MIYKLYILCIYCQIVVARRFIGLLVAHKWARYIEGCCLSIGSGQVGDLLGHAVDCSTAVNNVRAVQANDFVFG